MSYNEKRELEELETRIAAHEARKTVIETSLEENASDHLLVAQLYDELQTLHHSLDQDLERWTELAELQ